MSVSDSEPVTVKNANVAAVIKALNDGAVDEYDIVDDVSGLFVRHETFAKPFLAANGFELNWVLVKESILAHHGQFVNDGRPGSFAVKLLGLAQNGLLSLRFDPNSRIHSLLFVSPHLSFRG